MPPKKDLVYKQHTQLRSVKTGLLTLKPDPLKSVQSKLSFGFCYLDNDLRFIYVNNGMTVINGMQAEEYRGKTLEEVFPENATQIRPILEEILRKGKGVDFEFMVTGDSEPSNPSSPCSSQIWQVFSQPDQNKQGKILGITSVFIDITEGKRIETALRNSEERLARATRAGGVGIWDWYLENDELVWDKSMFRLYGISRADFSGAYDAWKNSLHPDDMKRAELEIKDALRDIKSFDTEFRIVRPDGEIRHIKSFGDVIYDRNKKPKRMIGTNWDITELKQAETRQADLARMIENSLNEIYIFDDTTLKFLEMNRAARENLGYTQEEMKQLTPLDIKPDFTKESFQNLIEPLHSNRKEKIVFESIHQRKNKTTYWVEVHLQKSTYLGKSVFTAIILDISERKRGEEFRAMALSIYESSTEAIMVTDGNHHIVDINPAFTQVTGFKRKDVIGKTHQMLHSDRHDEAFYKKQWKTVQEQGRWQGEIWKRRKDGTIYPVWLTMSIIPNRDDNRSRYISQFTDITEKKRKDEVIWAQANYDALTNLPNRRLLHDRLGQEMKKVHRAGSGLALLFIDLDHFKEINDTMGHAKGDLLLIESARRITTCVRNSDTIARLGGDEFTAIIPEFEDRKQIERIAQQIINHLSQPFYFKGDENGYYISASIGITIYPDDAENIEELLKNADQAMYQAKSEGRQRYNYFAQSMQLKAREKLKLTQDMRGALSNQELEVYYQPIVNLKTGEIVKSEALLRWAHPVLGWVSPGQFIHLAEESGLIHEIGEWVFLQVITRIKKWIGLTGRILPVCVNKSPLQFESESHGSTWSEQLEKLDLPGNSITMEITEGLLLKESPNIKRLLMSLRDSGIEVSIDDFGTGFSALSYLKKFDIDYIKIDRSFIRKIMEDDSDRVLTEAIIVMAHKLGIKAIAEGVETEAQRKLLLSFGCDFAQGFLYAPALPAEKFEALLVK